ncbi:MAG: hypothetical protein QM726_12030 [Chitinophagaceae bacterium]
MKKVILLNLLFFFLLMFIFFIAAFSMGYAANNKYGTDAGILFLLIVILHLFLNYIIMHRKQFNGRQILYASLVIGCVYLLIIFR